MNERKLQWTCPLCKKSASFESLRIDQRLQAITVQCTTELFDSRN